MDNNWHTNPKFLELAGDKRWRAICVFWGGLGFSVSHGLDGFVPYYALPTVHGTRREAADLVAVRLWQPCEGGWEINGFLEYQQSSEEDAIRSRKARDAAMVRWHGQSNADSNAPSNAPRNAHSNAKRNARTNVRTY
jgi:hypothetical protein